MGQGLDLVGEPGGHLGFCGYALSRIDELEFLVAGRCVSVSFVEFLRQRVGVSFAPALFSFEVGEGFLGLALSSMFSLEAVRLIFWN